MTKDDLISRQAAIDALHMHLKKSTKGLTERGDEMIAIKGMTMPKSCGGCVLRSYQGTDTVCSVTGHHIGRWERIGDRGRDYELRFEDNTNETRRTDCPLVEAKREVNNADD